MAGPWEKYGGSASAGDPVIAPPDPYKQANEARAQQDQALQVEAAARAARQEDRADRAEARSTQKDQQGTVEQNKAKGFLTRGIQANRDFLKLGDVGPRSLPGQAFADAFPNAANTFTSDTQRQLAEQAERAFIGAILRYDSGAAIPPQEFVTQGQIYFPRPGDGPEVLAQKAKAREVALKGLKDSAGPSASDIELDFGQPTEGDTVHYSQELPGGLTGSVTDEGSPQTPPEGGGYSLDSIANALKAGVGDIVEGAGGLIAMPGNAANAAINAAFGTNLSTDLAGDFRSELGLPENPNRFAAAINQGAAGALSGAGAARGLSQIANPGAYQNALLTVGRTPIRDMVAGGGAGFGSEITKDYGPLGQAAGTIAGGMLGYGGANALTRFGGPRSPTPLAQAAERQNVDLLPADVGGRGTRIVTSAARSSPFSANRVEQGAQRTQGQLATAVNRVARSQGDASDLDVAGQNVRNAAERFSKQTSERAARLYDRAYEASKGVKIKPLRTVAALDDEIARLQQNPDPASTSALRELTAFRDNIAGGVSVQGLRDARTSLSQGVYDGKLRSGADQARYKSILNNVATDISDGLKQAGREDAAGMFTRADEFWKARVEHIDEVLQPILGRSRSGEEIVSAIEGMTRGKQGGAMRLSRLLSNMTEDEAGNVRATIVDRLGKSSAGQQNAEGTAFSASTFLTNWNKMTPQAKASLFADKQMRRDLNDIAMLAEGTKASQALNNSSNTGAAFMGSAMGNMAVTSLPKMIVGAAVQAATGRLMASPKFARLLARAPKSPEAARKWTEQLGVLAGREPLLAADARALQQQLQQSLGQSPIRAAASEEEQN